MIELIVVIILFGSFLVMGVILYRKIPILAALPEQERNRTALLVLIKEKCIYYNPLKNFSLIKFLQKILLSIERQTNLWLKRIKEKRQRESGLADGYWQQLKETKINIIKEKEKRSKRGNSAERVKSKRAKKRTKDKRGKAS